MSINLPCLCLQNCITCITNERFCASPKKCNNATILSHYKKRKLCTLFLGRKLQKYEEYIRRRKISDECDVDIISLPKKKKQRVIRKKKIDVKINLG